jgi:hypothetical protein
MEVPQQHPYNPRLRSILLLFGSGLLLTAADWLPYWLPRGHAPTGFRFWESLLGLIPMAWALIAGARRICVERYLLLDNDSMVLPTGVFQMGTEKIEYTSIRSVYRHYGPYYGTLVLWVETDKRTFTIVPSFLPDNQSYEALEQFLDGKALENTSPEKSPRNQLAKHPQHTR